MFEKFTQLLKQIRDGKLQNIIFLDEKLFGDEEAFNNHNDRVSLKKSAISIYCFRKCPQIPKTNSVLVSERAKSQMFVLQG